jgi:hypothetical protein
MDNPLANLLYCVRGVTYANNTYLSGWPIPSDPLTEGIGYPLEQLAEGIE